MVALEQYFFEAVNDKTLGCKNSGNGMLCIYLLVADFALRCVGQPVGSLCITNYECARNAACIIFLKKFVNTKKA
jgi:hypothetical protein